MFTDEAMAKLGFRDGEQAAAALAAAARLPGGKQSVKRQLRAVRNKPANWLTDPVLGDLAALLVGERQAGELSGGLRAEPVPRRVWGRELVDPAALEQFNLACRLPIAVRGAQMPDGHVGYGLPIGGVLATLDAVVPYAVGVDIACRMRLTVCAEPPALLTTHRDTLRRALRAETRFGVGAAFEAGHRRHHEVMDEPVWAELPLLQGLQSRAAEQLGTSGSGNHFAEFGELTVAAEVPELALPAGRFLALLSHSGSRGLGAQIAEHYTKLAMAAHRLPDAARHLAWLELTSDAGREYWLAMELAGRYAAANHALLHQHVLAAAGLTAQGQVENHHNFAWRESHDGQEVIVHRKGATPAAAGVLGVIPGSMGDPGYVVRGLGHPGSLHSAAHGAGRRLSRKQACRQLTAGERNAYLAARGIELLAGGLDESPQAYKPIAAVMAAQRDLVEALAEFQPRLVLMAHGGPAED